MLKLLEEQKKQYDETGDYFKALLVRTMILFSIGTLFNMYGEKFANECLRLGKL